MRTLSLFALLAASSTASAAGVGSSVGTLAAGPGNFVPTLDLHFEPLILQIHVMDFLQSISDDDVQMGANLYFRVHETDFRGPFEGVVQPGVGFDLFVDPTVVWLTGDCRLGTEVANNNGGFGIYVVPAIRLQFDDNENDGDLFSAGGAVQISAWFGGR